MNGRSYRPWVGVAVCGAVLTYVGCSGSDRGEDPAALAPQTEPATAKASPSPSGKPLANLGNPPAVLIVTGEQNGYMEPCGCTEDQSGGLLRRYDLVERIHAQNWPTALIDLGGLIKDPAGARGGFEQAKLKFDYSVKALALLKYNALALAADDLKIGVGEALGCLDNSLGDTTRIVVANVEPDPVAYERLFRRSLVATAGPVKVGITAVIDPEGLKKLIDPDKDTLLPKVLAPDDVLPKVLADLSAESDFQVLMVQGPPEMARRLGTAYPGFDIVISTSEFPDPLNHDPDVLNGGQTMLVTVGKKGKYVGVFGLYPKETPSVRYQLVTLTKAFDGRRSPMKKLIEDEYRGTLKAAKVVENYLKLPYANGASGATFAGARSCKECHPNTYAFWSVTKHAGAFNSLLHDEKPDTAFDAECVTCHTTGFEFNSGWKSERETPYLAGNQCENCHGPCSKHEEQPDNAQFRKLIHLSAEQAEKNRFCLRCHDDENSRNFEFKKYWGMINHTGKDTYTDPKVHRGVRPRVAQKAH
jgi:methylphosphotriester-DNA--protein-cysteine methyltransferase